MVVLCMFVFVGKYGVGFGCFFEEFFGFGVVWVFVWVVFEGEFVICFFDFI